MKKIFKNKIIRRIIIVSLLLLLIGGGVFYFLKSIGGEDYSHTLIPAKQSTKGDWGFVNLDGELVVDFDLDLDSGEVVSYMYNNIAFYNDIDNENVTVTYIDNNLKETKTDYSQTLYFHDDMALVVEDFGPLKYINKDFEVALTLDYKEAGYFSEGYAKFKNNEDKWGFINKSGDVVIEADYTSVSSFIDGYSIVTLYDEDDRVTEYGVIDKEGNEIIDLSDRYTYLAIGNNKSFRFWADDEAGFIDFEGEEYIEEDWKAITAFINGYASFQEYDEDSENESKWGLINTDGEETIKAKENMPILLKNGLYKFKDDDEYGFKNIDKEKVIKAKYDQALSFFGEGAFVKKGKHWDYIDKDGEKIKKKDHNIKELSFDGNFEYYLSLYNTPFNLDATLKSNVVNIDNMLSSLFPTISYDIFGVDERSDVMDVLEYIESQSNLINDLESYDSDVDSLYNRISRYQESVNSYSLFNQYFEIDENFRYSIAYFFSDNIVEYNTTSYWNCYHSYSCSDYIRYYGSSQHKRRYYKTTTDYSRPYKQNPESSLYFIRAYLTLNNTAEGMGEKISEEIEDYLLDNDYNISGGKKFTKDNHEIVISPEYNQIDMEIRFTKNDK